MRNFNSDEQSVLKKLGKNGLTEEHLQSLQLPLHTSFSHVHKKVLEHLIRKQKMPAKDAIKELGTTCFFLADVSSLGSQEYYLMTEILKLPGNVFTVSHRNALHYLIKTHHLDVCQAVTEIKNLNRHQVDVLIKLYPLGVRGWHLKSLHLFMTMHNDWFFLMSENWNEFRLIFNEQNLNQTTKEFTRYENISTRESDDGTDDLRAFDIQDPQSIDLESSLLCTLVLYPDGIKLLTEHWGDFKWMITDSDWHFSTGKNHKTTRIEEWQTPFFRMTNSFGGRHFLALHWEDFSPMELPESLLEDQFVVDLMLTPEYLEWKNLLIRNRYPKLYEQIAEIEKLVKSRLEEFFKQPSAAALPADDQKPKTATIPIPPEVANYASISR